MKRVVCGVVLCALLAVTPVFAQIPFTMSYQGVLTNAGNPVDGTHSFVFTLFDVPSGGVGQWGEVQSVVVNRGQFSVILGSVTSLSSLSFTKPYYLEITVDGGAPLPRVPLASSPYSLGPWRSAGGNVYRESGFVGIGLENPSRQLTIYSTSSPTERFDWDTGFGGHWDIRANGTTANALQFDLNGSMKALFDENGNLGIGRVPATNRLEVEGDASKTTAGSWLANSDRRIKTDVKPISEALATLDRVRLVDFRYDEAYRKAHPTIEDRRYCNVIAQEFQQVFPSDVKKSGEKLANGEDILQVDTYPLTIYSAAAVQELHRMLEADEREIAELRRELHEQRELSSQIQAQVGTLTKAAHHASTVSASYEGGHK